MIRLRCTVNAPYASRQGKPRRVVVLGRGEFRGVLYVMFGAGDVEERVTQWGTFTYRYYDIVLRRSVDGGMTWEPVSGVFDVLRDIDEHGLGTMSHKSCIASSSDKLAICGNDGYWLTSDGISWTKYSNGSSGVDVSYAFICHNGVFHACSSTSENTMMMSTDGITWNVSTVLPLRVYISSSATRPAMFSVGGSLYLVPCDEERAQDGYFTWSHFLYVFNGTSWNRVGSRPPEGGAVGEILSGLGLVKYPAFEFFTSQSNLCFDYVGSYLDLPNGHDNTVHPYCRGSIDSMTPFVVRNRNLQSIYTTTTNSAYVQSPGGDKRWVYAREQCVKGGVGMMIAVSETWPYLVSRPLVTKLPVNTYREDTIVISGSHTGEAGSPVYMFTLAGRAFAVNGSDFAAGSSAWLYLVPDSVTITLDHQGGSSSVDTIPDMLYEGDSLYGSVPIPVRPGFLFLGYYAGPQSSGAMWYGPDGSAQGGIVVQGDTTVYAAWRAGTTVYVTFDPDGGVVSPAGKTVEIRGQYGTLPVPVKDGYMFNGWYDEGLVMTAGSFVERFDDHTLVARWVPTTILVTFDSCPDVKVVRTGEKYGPLPSGRSADPSKAFLSWAISLDPLVVVDENTIVTAASDHTLYAVLSSNPPDMIYVNLNPSGGTSSTTRIHVEKGSRPTGIEIPVHPDDTKSFYGYYNGSTKYVGSDGDAVRAFDFPDETTLVARYSTSSAVWV